MISPTIWMDSKADPLVIGRGRDSGLVGRLRANAYAILREAPCPGGDGLRFSYVGTVFLCELSCVGAVVPLFWFTRASLARSVEAEMHPLSRNLEVRFDSVESVVSGQDARTQ
jgi:hypothetical protein